VTVQDSSGHSFDSPPLPTTSWTPDRALARGEQYTWQVAATTHDREIVAPAPPAPRARFAVVTAPEAARLEHVSASPLARGILYAEAGLLDDAERELTAATSTPDGDLARAFLTQVRQARSATIRR
jgi:hypothetical protein